MNQIFLFCFIIFTTILKANDYAGGTTPKGIIIPVGDNEISIEEEKLFISEKKIEVEYKFYNSSNKDKNLLVVFPLPDGDSDPIPPEFYDFKLWIDNKPTHYETEQRCVDSKGNDFTEEIKKIGVNNCETFDLKKANKNIVDKLLSKGLLINSYGDNYTPRWIARYKFYWKQIFPAKSIINIKHTYKPDIGAWSVSQPAFDWSSEETPDYDTVLQKGCSKEKLKPCECMLHQHLFYILTTANTWKGPIKKFHLNVRGNLFFIKFGGTLSDESSKGGTFGVGEMEWEIKNFRPEKDLFVEFSNPSPQSKCNALSQILEAHYLYKFIHGPANLRDAPEGKITFSIPDKKKVRILNFKDGWFKIDYNGKQGFTFKNNIRYFN